MASKQQPHCRDCFFFVHNSAQSAKNPNDGTGSCHRYPPQINAAASYLLAIYQAAEDLESRLCGAIDTEWEETSKQRNDDESTNFFWPAVGDGDNDFCGEFKSK